ncbi:MAG: CaiB/BaiF CoA transferase family protein [Thermoplasmata archaeon]
MSPLAGIRVLDLSRVLAGPFCSMVLGDLGAEVIKAEPPEGDVTRSWGPPFRGGESGYYLSLNRNKRSLCLDLRKEGGLRILRRLAGQSDVVLENFRPGVADRLGIGYEQVREWKEDIVYCSISGYGQDGPYRDRASFDIILQALGGFMSITGEEGRPPVRVGVAIADIGAGLHAALAILAALWRRAQTQEGAYLDISILDGHVSWLTYMAQAFFLEGEPPGKLGSAHPHIVPYQAFPTADDPIVVAAANDAFWRGLCRALGEGELAEEPDYATNELRVTHRDALVRRLVQRFQERGREYWLTRMEAEGVPAAPVQNLREVFEDPQVTHRGLVEQMQHRTLGAVTQLRSPVHTSAWTPDAPRPPPLKGEHTREILGETGYSDLEIDRLAESRVVTWPPEGGDEA